MIRDISPPLSSCQNGSAIPLRRAEHLAVRQWQHQQQHHRHLSEERHHAVQHRDRSDGDWQQCDGRAATAQYCAKRHPDQQRRDRHGQQQYRQQQPVGAVGCGPGVADVWATGILLFDAGAGTINNNAISGNDGGLVAVATTVGQSFFRQWQYLFSQPLRQHSGQRADAQPHWQHDHRQQLGVVARRRVRPIRWSICPVAMWSVRRRRRSHRIRRQPDRCLCRHHPGQWQPVCQQCSRCCQYAGSGDGEPGLQLVGGSPYGPINLANPLGQGNPATVNTTFTNWAIDNTTFACTGNPQNNILPGVATDTGANLAPHIACGFGADARHLRRRRCARRRR